MEKPLVGVLQIISSLEVGGSEKLLLELLSACRDDDRVNFTVVVMNQAINPLMRERLDRMGLNVYYLDRPEGHLHPKYLWQLLQIIRRHRVQLVHAHNLGSKMWAMLCKLTCPGLKMAFTIHDTQMLPRLSATQVFLHQRLIDQHIAISKTVASLCESRSLKNYRQIYNGIDLKHWQVPERSSLVSRTSLAPFSERALRILHVGRMDYSVKGQDILLKSVALCRDAGLNVQCTLMGGVYAYSKKSYQALQELVRELNLSEHVTFHINQQDVAAQMAQADLFVLPSRSEGLGLVVLEAMASGLPVISSNTDGPRELVQDGVTGLLFENGSAEALFEKIRAIFLNPALADSLRNQAEPWVLQFDVHEMKRQYYALYDSLVRNSARRDNPPINTGRLTHDTGI
jgi:glycosyltransferase involved in cell wall biosynthesis